MGKSKPRLVRLHELTPGQSGDFFVLLAEKVRGARRDGKPGYLRHVPRLWRYLERDLAHPDLSSLRAWFDRHLGPELRARPIEA